MDESARVITDLLSSSDFRFRLFGEFLELCNRIERLQDFLKTLGETQNMQMRITTKSEESLALLREQYEVMMKYRDILFNRVKIIFEIEQKK